MFYARYIHYLYLQTIYIVNVYYICTIYAILIIQTTCIYAIYHIGQGQSFFDVIDMLVGLACGLQQAYRYRGINATFSQ